MGEKQEITYTESAYTFTVSFIGVLIAGLLGIGIGWLAFSGDDCEVQVESDSVAILSAVNDYRIANGRAPLQPDATLGAAAQWMAEDMSAHEYFSHTDSQGRDPFQRMAAFGYPAGVWMGENLALDAADAQTVLDAWVNSPGHNAILLAREATEAGVGLAGRNTVLDVGGAVDAPVVTPAPTPMPTIPTPQPAPVETPCQ